MRKTIHFMAVPVLILAMAGCEGSVGTTRDGHSITGRTAVLSWATLHSDSQDTTITLGRKTVHVTKTQITWANGGSLPLPEKWSSLELRESWDAIVFNVDGTTFATIHPVV